MFLLNRFSPLERRHLPGTQMTYAHELRSLVHNDHLYTSYITCTHGIQSLVHMDGIVKGDMGTPLGLMGGDMATPFRLIEGYGDIFEGWGRWGHFLGWWGTLVGKGECLWFWDKGCGVIVNHQTWCFCGSGASATLSFYDIAFSTVKGSLFADIA